MSEKEKEKVEEAGDTLQKIREDVLWAKGELNDTWRRRAADADYDRAMKGIGE